MASDSSGSPDFSELDMSKALDLYAMIAGTGAFDLDDPHDQKILAEVGVMGAVIARDLRSTPVGDVDGFVKTHAPLVDKLTGKTQPTGGELDG